MLKKIVFFFLFPFCLIAKWYPQTIDQLIPPLYHSYKKHLITHEGRVVRLDQGKDTVSEGQAYAMLLAVWMGDQETFDRCYAWSEQNLARKEDHLLAWLWDAGEVQDWNSATDADLDYAMALILAHQRWKTPQSDALTPYLERAKGMTTDLLEYMTLRTKSGNLLLLPGRWALDEEPIPINPSYFSPGWYAVFNQYFPDPRWKQLIDSSYRTLNKLVEEGFFPDWCAITSEGDLVTSSKRSSIYSWEAFRIPWRVYFHWHWFYDRQAYHILSRVDQLYERMEFLQMDLGDVAFYSPYLLTSKVVFPGTVHAAFRRLIQMVENDNFRNPTHYYRNSWLLLSLITYKLSRGRVP